MNSKQKPISKNNLEQYNKELNIAEKEIQNGNFNSHSEVKNKIQQWKKSNLINPTIL